MTPAFFPFPYPVTTPLKGDDGQPLQGYAIYVTPSPLWENDVWAVQLDDSRILHFSTNQLRGVANGTYGIAPPKADPNAPENHVPACVCLHPQCGAKNPKEAGPSWSHACVVTGGRITLFHPHCGACGEHCFLMAPAAAPPTLHALGPFGQDPADPLTRTRLCGATSGNYTYQADEVNCHDCLARRAPKPTAPSSATASAARRMAQKRR